MPALQSQDKESVNNHHNNGLGGLKDADVKDEPPILGTDLVHENDVSDKI